MNTRAMLCAVLLVGLSVLGIQGCQQHDDTSKPWRVVICYLGPHELIKQTVDGIRQGMGQSLDGRPVEIIERHANNDMSQLSAMMNGAIALRPNLLVTLTTPVSLEALKDKPASMAQVFVAVTDPTGSHLVESLDKPEITTGVSDVPPLGKMLADIRAIAPNVKHIAFLYSPGEEPAVYSRHQIEELAPSLGFTIDVRPVTNQDELPSLATAAIRKNDALVIGADNELFNAAPVLAKISLDARKPFFAADSTSVRSGAAAGVTVDYHQVGMAGATLIQRVLRGEKVGEIPVVSLTDGFLEVNSGSLKKLGISLLPTMQSQVHATYP